jgi:hypothetical protein
VAYRSVEKNVNAMALTDCIGPILCIISASDLNLRSAMNVLCKYADDSTLMVPENIDDVRLENEFRNVAQWSV